MQPLRVHSISLGCPKNRVDTERMLACLGPDIAPSDTPEEADLVLINTCGFIAPAVEESVQAILDAAQAIEDMAPRPVLAVISPWVCSTRMASRTADRPTFSWAARSRSGGSRSPLR